MRVAFGAVLGSGGGDVPPPLPPFSDVVIASGLWHFRSGAADAVQYIDSDPVESHLLPFTITAPFPADWGSLAGAAPYSVPTFYGQTGDNDFTAAGAASPTLVQTSGVAGHLAFDGVANGIRGVNTVNATTGTIYIYCQPLSLAETGVLLESGDGVTITNQLSIQMVAGVLTCTVYEATPLANTKIKTLSTTDPVLICFQFDTTLATPADQTALFVNGVTTGVTSPISTDLNDAVIGDGSANLGARNNGASAFLTANVWNVLAFNVYHDTTQRQAWEAYLTYLSTL